MCAAVTNNIHEIKLKGLYTNKILFLHPIRYKKTSKSYTEDSRVEI